MARKFLVKTIHVSFMYDDADDTVDQAEAAFESILNLGLDELGGYNNVSDLLAKLTSRVQDYGDLFDALDDQEGAEGVAELLELVGRLPKST